jgi:hypothetical protein
VPSPRQFLSAPGSKPLTGWPGGVYCLS